MAAMRRCRTIHAFFNIQITRRMIPLQVHLVVLQRALQGASGDDRQQERGVSAPARRGLCLARRDRGGVYRLRHARGGGGPARSPVDSALGGALDIGAAVF